MATYVDRFICFLWVDWHKFPSFNHCSFRSSQGFFFCIISDMLLLKAFRVLFYGCNNC